MSLDQFKAAKLFENLEKWHFIVAETKKCGGHIDKLAEKVAMSGEVSVTHPMVYHKNKQNVSFLHSKADGNFDDMDKLVSHFREMSEKDRNLKNIRTRPGDAQLLINKLLKRECIKIVDPKDKDKLVLNPAGLLDRGKNKTQLLVHYLGNAAYTRPKLKLDQVKHCANQIRQFDRLHKTDLTQAYWQYKVSEESSWQLGFSVNGVLYRCLGLPFGPACCVYIVQIRGVIH